VFSFSVVFSAFNSLTIVWLYVAYEELALSARSLETRRTDNGGTPAPAFHCPFARSPTNPPFLFPSLSSSALTLNGLHVWCSESMRWRGKREITARRMIYSFGRCCRMQFLEGNQQRCNTPIYGRHSVAQSDLLLLLPCLNCLACNS
jgi:hypothetical protein